MTTAETTTQHLPEMQALGFNFTRWQDAVEAAIATNLLAVTGEVRGGQLIQYQDPSGAQLNILAVEPYATFIGFASVTQNFAHVTMVNDVLALLEVVDPFGTPLAQVTANLAQGPLLADAPSQQWQQIGITALGLAVESYDSVAAYENENGAYPAAIESEGADIVTSGSGAQVPTAGVRFAGRVMESQWRTNELSGERFIHVVMDGPFPFDVCLPASYAAGSSAHADSVAAGSSVQDGLPAKDSVLAGSALLTATVIAPTGGGCGDGGGCACGSGGCGGH